MLCTGEVGANRAMLGKMLNWGLKYVECRVNCIVYYDCGQISTWVKLSILYWNPRNLFCLFAGDLECFLPRWSTNRQSHSDANCCSFALWSCLFRLRPLHHSSYPLPESVCVWFQFSTAMPTDDCDDDDGRTDPTNLYAPLEKDTLALSGCRISSWWVTTELMSLRPPMQGGRHTLGIKQFQLVIGRIIPSRF